jgi:hypothetical protein
VFERHPAIMPAHIKFCDDFNHLTWPFLYLCTAVPAAADDKLTEMGLDIAAIQKQLSAGSLTSKAAVSSSNGSNGSSGSNASSTDYSQLQTHGYCLQEAAAGQAAKARCLQAVAGGAHTLVSNHVFNIRLAHWVTHAPGTLGTFTSVTRWVRHTGGRPRLGSTHAAGMLWVKACLCHSLESTVTLWVLG